MKTYLAFLCLIFVLSAQTIKAQCKGFNPPENPELRTKVEEKRAIYEDYVRAEEYKSAIATHQWLLTNTPDLYLTLYINGEKIFSQLAKNSATQEEKSHYADSLMIIYDLRMKYCPDNKILDRKATSALLYYQKDKSKLKWVLDVFDENLEQNKENVKSSNLKNHMLVMKLNKVYLKNLDSEDIFDRYNKISTVLDQKEDGAKYREEVDDIFIDLLGSEFGCEETKKYLVPKFKENPDDVQLARNIFQFMLKGKCTDEPIWLEAAEAVFGPTPDFGLAKVIGQKHASLKNYEKATFYFERALELDKKDEKQAEVHLLLGNLEATQGNKTNARNHYKSAIQFQSDLSAAYTAIGNLYFNSFNDCAKKDRQVDDRAVYFAAYQMYAKAGNKEQMKAARMQFPLKETVFTETRQVGEKIQVGCWINEVVTIMTRD